MDRFKVSSLGMRPRVPASSCERKCNCGTDRIGTAPRGISHHRSRPVSGLVGSVRIAFPGARAPSGRARVERKAPDSGCWLIRPRHLPLRGQQRLWKDSGPGFGRGRTPPNPRSESASAPLSRFTPARVTRQDTSNERVDCTTQVAALYPSPASGIYIENESLHLDLTGFSKL